MTDISTRMKILEVAHKLFAEKGYAGVSIREIASRCDVNVAAINYHFSNKEKLYVETMRSSILNTQQRIETIYNELHEPSVEELAVNVFQYFVENTSELRTAFKLVLSFHDFQDALGDGFKKFNGPPGGEYFYQCLKNEVPEAKEEDLGWAVRSIFTQVIHKSLIICNKSICDSLHENGLGVEVFESDLKRLVNLVVNDLIK